MDTHSRIKVAEGVDITEVFGRMFVGLLEAAVIVVDDRVEDLGEHGVRLGVGRVDAYAGVVVLQAGLDHIEQRGAERRLACLQLIEHLLRQVFLQQRLAVGSRQLGIAGLQLVQNGCVHHVVALFTEKQRRNVDHTNNSELF